MSETIKRVVQQRLAAEAPGLLDAPSRFERRVRVREAVARVLAEEGIAMAPSEIASLVHSIADAIVGLGPLEALLRDPSITEVMVVNPKKIFVERNGTIEPSDVSLSGEHAVRHVIERIVSPLGLRVDDARPWVDARLPDGSRVHAIIPPLAVNGAVLTIRKFAATPLTAPDLIESGTWSLEVLELLAERVRAKTNVVVCGGTGAGKTTLLNVLSSFIPQDERIVTIEDAAELRLAQNHVVSLETRAPNVEGRGAVSIRDLVRNALRMRPDRIVVGEVRGGEAFDMLQAMNTGHEGSMSTAHANSAADLIERLEAMVLMSGAALPIEAVRRQIAAALDLIVAVERGRDGVRRVTEVMEVQPDCSLRPAAQQPRAELRGSSR
ncbi:MAG: CpaF family protein [Actinomycetota bacterium]